MGPISEKIFVYRLHLFFFHSKFCFMETTYSYNCLLYGVGPSHGRISVRKYSVLFSVPFCVCWGRRSREAMLLILYLRFHHEHRAPVDRRGGSLKPLRVLNHLTSSTPTGLLPPFVLGRPPGEEACILTSFCAFHTGRREL